MGEIELVPFVETCETVDEGSFGLRQGWSRAAAKSHARSAP